MGKQGAGKMYDAMHPDLESKFDPVVTDPIIKVHYDK